MTDFVKHKRGILGTVVFHISILLILIFFGFFTPLPLPGEEGILVNFGTSDQGFGNIEPAPQRGQQATPPPTRSEPVPPPPPRPAATPPPSKPEPAKETAMTQDYEQTAAIDASEKKRSEENEKQRKLEEQRRIEQQKVAEAERQKQAEIERQRQAELVRQRQAELERQRQAELERQKREEEQRRIAEINSRAQGAFGGNASGPGGQGTGTNPNQGATFPGGNQGVPTGDPNAGTYGPGGSGDGSQGTGVSFDLSGRSAKTLPKPVYPGNEEGVVIVRITVDKNGNVTAAEAGARGTTIMNQQFWNEARQAALKAKFNVDNSAQAFQQGTITYRFRLN